MNKLLLFLSALVGILFTTGCVLSENSSLAKLPILIPTLLLGKIGLHIPYGGEIILFLFTIMFVYFFGMMEPQPETEVSSD